MKYIIVVWLTSYIRNTIVITCLKAKITIFIGLLLKNNEIISNFPLKKFFVRYIEVKCCKYRAKLVSKKKTHFEKAGPPYFFSNPLDLFAFQSPFP